MLQNEESLCKEHQRIIVSHDRKSGNQCEHIARNQKQQKVRQYKLDDILVRKKITGECCDFAVINDDNRKAYLIELKGQDIQKGISQLKAGALLLREDIPSYELFYRYIYRTSTHEVRSSDTQKWIRKAGRFKGIPRVIVKNMRLEEDIDGE